jgi:lycopene cyclase domain-containing protein
VTYSGFLALFVWVPLAAVVWRCGVEVSSDGWRALGLLLVIVYVATTPWDSAAVARGLWDFDPGRIAGMRLGRLPIEEYLFFGLQAALTGVWVLHRLARR